MIRRCIVVACALGACGQPAPAPPPAPTVSPHDELAAMDTRTPVPLLPMMAHHQKQQMQDHLLVVQEIVGGLAAEDWAAVTSAAQRMGSSPQMAMTCEHMGVGADGFTERALDFHKRADAIVEAAEGQDAAAVLRATHHTLEACTSCHATYRQEVLTPEAHRAATGSAGPHP